MLYEVITIAAARERGVPVLVDPKGSDFERYRGATLLTPNLKEFEAVVGRCESDSELRERGMALRQRLEPDAVRVLVAITIQVIRAGLEQQRAAGEKPRVATRNNFV